MDAESARTALAGAFAVLPSRDPENFVLAGEDVESATVSRFDLTAAMAGQVRDDVAGGVESLARRQFLPYDPSYQTSSSQVLVEELAAVPALARVDALIRNRDVPVHTGGGPSVVAMAHAAGGGEDGVVAYRLKGPGIATRSARWVQLIPREGVYAPITDEVLFYEPRFDVFTCAGYAYFTTVTLIQTKLQADAKARELARRTLAAVTGRVTIIGAGELEQAVMDDPAMRAKLAAIARLVEADPEYASHLTTERLVRFVKDNPDYQIPVGEVDGRPALRFDPSPQHRHQIPKLLADDYLHSQLTQRNYEAGSKQRVAG